MNVIFEKSGTAFLFPDKIVIETTNKKDAGTWYSAGSYTLLPLEVSDFELGKSVLNHLEQSKQENVTYEIIKENWKALIKKAKYKTEKAIFENAKCLTIKMGVDKVEFVPFKTYVSRRMFARLPGGITERAPTPEFSEIGKEVRRGWEKCLLID